MVCGLFCFPKKKKYLKENQKSDSSGSEPRVLATASANSLEQTARRQNPTPNDPTTPSKQSSKQSKSSSGSVLSSEPTRTASKGALSHSNSTPNDSDTPFTTDKVQDGMTGSTPNLAKSLSKIKQLCSSRSSKELSSRSNQSIGSGFNTVPSRKMEPVKFQTLFEALDLSESMIIDVSKDLQMVDQIASAGAATIHRATITNVDLRDRLTVVAKDSAVAVKMIKEPPNISSDRIRPAFQQEVAIAWVLRTNRHFVQLLGYCSCPMALILKYYPLGSLDQVILNPANPQLSMTGEQWTPAFQLDIACDIANAISHMHTIGIVHNDIKPANILLDRDERTDRLVALLCDFGIANVIGRPVTGVQSIGTSLARGASAPYAAPEVFQALRTRTPISDTKTRTAADIYAFGVSLFEVVARRKAWEKLSAVEIEDRVGRGERPSGVEREGDKVSAFLWSTIEVCWMSAPAMRPEATVLFRTLDCFRQVQCKSGG